METSDLIQLVDASISHFDSKISERIDEIISSNEEAVSIHRNVLTGELIKQLYNRTFSNSNFKLHQLVIHTPETKFYENAFDLFFKAPGLALRNLQFVKPYPPGRIINTYLDQNPDLDLLGIKDEFSELLEYRSLQEKLISKYGEFLDGFSEVKITHKDRAKQFLNNLLIITFIKYLRGQLSDNLKQEYTEVFLNELFNHPQRISYLASLSGLGIYQTVPLGSNYYLKKYDGNDFNHINEFALFTKQEEIHLPNLFVLKIDSKLSSITDLYAMENHLLNIIRLFTFSEVYISYRVFFRESINQIHKLHTSTFQHKKSDYVWTLPANCKDTLTEFATTLFPIFQNQIIEESHKGIQFALERFDWSMRDDLGVERRLLFAVMGLEPLYLPEHSWDKATKLSERVSKLLEGFSFDQTEVKEDVKQAYKFRNQIVHGSKYPMNWEEKLSKLYPKILNYLRVSIVFFLLNLSLGRDTIAKLIADSLTSDDKKKELQKIINPIKNRFDVCFNKYHHSLQ